VPNLYELASEFAALNEAVSRDDLTDDEMAALLDQIDESRTDLKVKVDNICRLRANLAGEAGVFKTEEQRLGQRRKAIENRVGQLEDWMRSTMVLLDVPVIKTDLHDVKVHPGRGVAVIDDPSKIPDLYIKVERTPKKKEILDALKKGEEVPGASLGEGKAKLVIR